MKSIRLLEVDSITDRCTSVPKLKVAIEVNDINVSLELDTATARGGSREGDVGDAFPPYQPFSNMFLMSTTFL